MQTDTTVPAITTQSVTRPDGRIVTTTFEDGVLVKRAVSDGADTRGWDSIVTTYDATGAIESRTQVNDNGVTTLSGYEGGVVVSRLQTDVDDVNGWASRLTLYDEQGRRVSTDVVADNGVRTETLFGEDGQRDFVIRTDEGDTASWTRQAVAYDDDGALRIRERINDNGVVEATEWADGQVVAAGLADTADQFDWQFQEEVNFANGSPAVQGIAYDDGSDSVSFFDTNGTLVRLEERVAGFSSDEFAFVQRTTDYDADRNIVGREVVFPDWTAENEGTLYTRDENFDLVVNGEPIPTPLLDRFDPEPPEGVFEFIAFDFDIPTDFG